MLDLKYSALVYINRNKRGETSSITSEEYEMSQIVKVQGTSIGNPELSWVHFADEETFTGMTTAGMSQAIVNTYVEMGTAINSGIL